MNFESYLQRIEQFFTGWHFPVFIIAALVQFSILIGLISMIPISDSVLGTFAEEFKIWCLGYNPQTGEIESIYLAMYIVQPMLLTFFVFLFWLQPLKEVWTTKKSKMLPIILPTTVLIIAVAISLPQLYNSSRQEIAFDFPAEDLRTELPVPDFALVNHRYELVTAEDFKGEVSIITAVYASCNETCPLILEQIKRVFGKLDKKIQDQVNVLIISMNPEKDTAGILSVTAEHYEFFHPNFQLLTGEPSRVDHLLDLFSIPRYKKYDGTIDHANMFIVIDKKGKIAYRFALGPNQEEWLLEAIQLLVNETNIALQ